MCGHFPSTCITDKSFIKLQTKLKTLMYSTVETTRVADREVQFLSDIDAIELIFQENVQTYEDI